MADLFSNSKGNFNDSSNSPGLHNLRGEITKVVFSSDDGSYVVMKLYEKESAEEITLVGSGSLVNVSEGEEIEAVGNWEKHKNYGRQFRAQSFKAVLPTSADGIERYLSSGIIPGIGPKMAGRIVDTFGEKTLEILDRYTSRLKEVPGLGKKKIEEIQKVWSSFSERRETDLFLSSLGVSPAYCHKIFNTYGNKTAEIIKENPYLLAKDVKGMGFIMSDRIARNMGLELDNPFRLGSGAIYALEKQTENGHVCYPENALLGQVADMLGVNEEKALEGLDRAVADGLAVRVPEEECPVYYPKRLYYAEKRLAEDLHCLMTAPLNGKGKLKDFFNDHLNEEQRQAVENVFRYPVSIITGGPGVGKTTTVDEIVQQAKSQKLKVSLAAPTGRAAKRMSEATGREAKTIHRLLIFDPKDFAFVHHEGNKLQADLIIVDEVSMLDLSLASQLFKAIEIGTRIVLVGDKDQLPSVGSGAVLHDLLASKCLAVTMLKQVYRQAQESRIIANAYAVNNGLSPDLRNPAKSEVGDFYWIEQEDSTKVEALIAEMMSKRIPERFGYRPLQVQVLTPMNKGLCGGESLNDRLQASLNSIHKPQFKFGEKRYIAGDRVMQRKNNYEKNVFNGDMGIIVSVDSKNGSFSVDYEGHVVEYEKVEADQVSLAYAVTIHKSQGSEFPVVIIPLVSQHYVMLQRNLLYTAITRAKELLILIGSRRALELCIHNNRESLRFTRLQQELQKYLPEIP